MAEATERWEPDEDEGSDAGADASPAPAGPTTRGCVLSGTIALLLGMLGVLLLGIPGAFLLAAVEYVASGGHPPVPLAGGGPQGHLSGDAAWPAAIFLTLLAPLGLVPGYLLGARTARKRGRRIRGPVQAAVAILWAVAMAVWVYHWG